MVQSLKYTATPKNIATAKPTKIFFLSPPPIVTLITLSLSLSLRFGEQNNKGNSQSNSYSLLRVSI